MIVSTELDDPGATAASTDGASTSGSRFWSRLLRTLKLFLCTEHRCSPPVATTGWTPAPSDSRAAGGYVCPECGLHWRREA